MDERIHILGIRHHGPGSAASVEAALDSIDPEVVLIEGPVEASELIRFVDAPGMQPPVALLLYPKGCPEHARFFPFAEFSPEWRAMLWAVTRQRAVEFIDLPTQARTVDAVQSEHADETMSELESDEMEVAEEEEMLCSDDQHDAPVEDDSRIITGIVTDPLNELARVAGHSDGESWWSAVVEQSVQSPAVFDVIGDMMAAVRSQFESADSSEEQDAENELQREAHMRLRLRDALKRHEGQVAVICGAWHVPALRELKSFTIKADKARLKSTKAIACECCWIPWTDQRLAASSGYRAGVISPGWYRHLWRQHTGQKDEAREIAHWQGRVASLLRNEGYDASTASVIEATRLVRSLSAVRGLSAPGLVEMQDASLSALCHGNLAPLQIVESRLVIGNAVGKVDESAPQPHLLTDLSRLQKKLRLKPEALEREIRLDLRSGSGMAKSELLHRLTLLDVPWGRMTDAEAGRGTFREIWTIQWQPEHAVALAEAAIFGPTIDIASAASAVAKAEELVNAQELAALLRLCLLSNLPQAVRLATARLQAIAASSADISSLMSILSPLADIKRYGTARDIPTGELDTLIECIAIEVVSGFRYACHQLDEDAAAEMRALTQGFDRALDLVDTSFLQDQWTITLSTLADDDRASPLLRGLATRLLHNKRAVESALIAQLLSRNLAPAVPVHEAGAWLDGFINESGEVFVQDDELFMLVDQWLESVAEDQFIEVLPVLRRSFADFDPVLRRRLLQRVHAQPAAVRSAAPIEDDTSPGALAFNKLMPLLNQLLEISDE